MRVVSIAGFNPCNPLICENLRFRQGLKKFHLEGKKMSKPLKGFITHSHEDKQKKKKLRTCLAVMEQAGEIKLWDDDDITAGGKASQEDLLKKVVGSDILIYLVSADSLASENCKKELIAAVRAERRVISIILESCDWPSDRLSNFEVLPDKGKPINKWRPQSDGWQNVVDGVREVVGEMQTQADSSSETSDEELRAELAFQHGNAMRMIGQFERAIEHYSRAIELNPDYAAVYNNRGNAYSVKSDFDRAIADYTKAIQLKPGNSMAYNNRGAAFSSKCDFDRAIADHTKAIQLKPDYADAYYNRGNTYVKKDDYDRAIIDYSKAVQLKPDYASAYNNRGAAYSEQDDYDRAIIDYTKAIQLKPDYAGAYCHRGLAWLSLAQWSNAKSDLRIAKEKGVDIIALFRNDYENAEDFEQKNSVNLPEDIAEILTPQPVVIREDEGWEATHELANDPEIVKSLERAEADVEAGRLKRWSDVRRDD